VVDRLADQEVGKNLPPRCCLDQMGGLDFGPDDAARRVVALGRLDPMAEHFVAEPQRRTVQRCAIYTRKSTEDGLEQEFNSLDAQREACAAYILSQRHEGWVLVPEPYDDGGLSGGTWTVLSSSNCSPRSKAARSISLSSTRSIA
jgi:hypothetical protein